ncbi:MAG: methionyl-tRNA formyltransferase [Candidatus Improbicoccus pseudotrichonymphae]|uniref:Methionyl-tRNA formyltransferase n=1 Tax=Candidatus Improbicoccus pseudotrichonymphae TaxID=3033792 RepID=A0AA48KZ37_9FIRM|nr:MAG: methionyl-tRNA formyltransferase [Candidatus Improbicoccus pseudotrichonymphae]
MKRVVFIGSSEFALPSLSYLVENGFEVLFVITQPDGIFGSKKKLKPTPVHIFAESKKIEVFMPKKLKNNDEAFFKILNSGPDLIITASYGNILPLDILKIPKFSLNVHGSLLPKWRGASPVQHSIISGDTKTGVSIIEMDENVDTGDILGQMSTDIKKDETSEELMKRLSILGAECLSATIKDIIENKITRIKQDDRNASYASIIKKEDALIDWSKSADEIKNLVNGMLPWPVAYTYLNKKRLKIFKVKVIKNLEEKEKKPGRITNKELLISCGKDFIQILELQLESKKKMFYKEFVNGYNFECYSFSSEF